MTPMFSIFTLAIKFDCLFLTVFQSFHSLVSFVFDKLPPPPPPPPLATLLVTSTNHVIAGPDLHRARPLELWRFLQHFSAKYR